MSGTNGLGAFRFPTSPYPGLRPFLDHEAALFLGRKRQIDDVVKRLTQSQFVAVVGGSGSGKSSLVRAGVVPKLRGYGIPDAGDYWVPVVFTPGTTAMLPTGDSASEADVPANQTPITRLAWKFSQQLEPAELPVRRRLEKQGQTAEAGNVDADRENARRLDGIATIFRQGAGFARLVDAYTEDLPAAGPDRKNARFLFVIDQFEELFHPNNKGNADTRTLIEAIIDHFFSPHPRCFVILTMRSEHLADCAGYLELPDAINESVYLVRRPDEDELRDAITGPAKVFLRLLQRGDSASSLPDDIVFADAVIARLLKDVERIADDPDHLPLLQHLLARIWQVASARCGVDGQHGVPNDIQWGDLELGADPKAKEAGWLRQRDDLNTLRASLENWAKATYDDKSDEDRKHIDFVLERLAFKDPNNGTYNQQRLDVNDPGLFAGDATRTDKLRDLLENGYLDSVHYLYWDKENPARVTLKVSHESFIRGWSHFRGLVDAEAERFEEFLNVLRRCSDWQEAARRPELLLGQAELIRLDAAGLGPVLMQADLRDEWFRTLKQFREGERLGVVKTEVADYIASSRALLDAEAEARRILEEREHKAQENARRATERQERMVAEQKREAQTRRRKRWVITGAFFVLAPFVATYPVMMAVDKFGMARQQVELRYADSATPDLGAADRELAKLLAAADLAAMGRDQSAYVRSPASNLFNWLPQVTLAKKLLEFHDTDYYVNGNLRRRLTTGMWHSATNPDAGEFKQEKFIPDKPLALDCVVDQAGKGKAVRGVLYPEASKGRGIFVKKRDYDQWEDVELYSARYAKQDGTCQTVDLISKPNNSPDTFILFDARIRYMAVSRSGLSDEPPSVSLFKIHWDDDEKSLSARAELLTQVIGEEAVAILRKEIEAQPKQDGDPRVKSVLSWREVGGIGVRVAGLSWRLFADGAQRIIGSPGSDQDWQPLAAEAPEDSGCGRLNKRLKELGITPGFDSLMYHHDKHCFQIQKPGAAGPGRAPTAQRAGPNYASKVLIGVYDEPILLDLLAETTPVPVASISPFAGARWAGADWMVGVSGPYEGWLAVRQKDDKREFVGAPWSTSALVKLGREVVNHAPAPSPAHQNPPGTPAAQ
ncbi:hypothetical protein LZ012_04785 [Dechloromonas sp. XY25]|uniref:Novel STAND NTPase 1 domain-containing protein n=1 Tax=Dechloromonas hankyongensis TaxID=2908002 RepID=A0ABS9JZK1_9RHOO|nr:hypothetical protein [Dechloromonas hankyongensis]MCG2576306.1 hypothetical protein [Dechloromonas hankyongensis]